MLWLAYTRAGAGARSGYLIGLADTLISVGRPEPARRLVGIALCFRVKAISNAATRLAHGCKGDLHLMGVDMIAASMICL